MEDNFNEIFAPKLTVKLTITTTLVIDASPSTPYIIIVTLMALLINDILLTL